MTIDFSGDTAEVYSSPRHLSFEACATAVSDRQGDLQFYSNNIAIHSWADTLMENGDSINFNIYWQLWQDGGYVQPQYCLALPITSIKYYLFHSERERYQDFPNPNVYLTEYFRYSEIDMTANGGMGKVIKKNIPLVADTIDNGKVTATRHANGRDWWVVVGGESNNLLYRFLATPDTILDYGPQVIGDSIPSGLGQGAFSPDGTKYARVNSVYFSETAPRFIDVYDFDRCTGEFSNPRNLTYTEPGLTLTAGLAFSENSRFLYIASRAYMYQYDLETEDIVSSKVQISNTSELDGLGFFLCGLGPDGKIYVGGNGTQQYMTRIHSPNRRSHACDFGYKDLELPHLNFRTIPNFPYYGLGPLDGSPCDTLGIDNPIPTARFEYWQEDSTSNFVEFFDASHFAYEWEWSYGDPAGSTSSARHPVLAMQHRGRMRSA